MEDTQAASGDPWPSAGGGISNLTKGVQRHGASLLKVTPPSLCPVFWKMRTWKLSSQDAVGLGLGSTTALSLLLLQGRRAENGI